ncbi:cation:proton antiporter [Brevibacillus centrosporus]|uniref:cation:proton antiporter n=1 Tax=Brevibacillus centrosporus TaxID=54910 RepID=UPI000F0A7039|nr:cation:proton antiporter [Brevibacillus centrosporus]MEC2131413.1 cation:proton antiporter [Brevibacillus centrosporus]RNB72559.1 cation:proton antiporter [Brevibacillus centrosporus]GED31153.1 K(+)/H(+) antiporter YhaU [Brevibacillus centrosporus]
MEHIVFEVGLALALIALAGFLSVKLKFSIVPFYILVGMVVGPHAPDIGLFDLRFIQSAPLIEFMGRVGVLFLLFYLGLEFSVGRLIKAGRSIAVGGTIYIVINFTLGLLFGWVAGFPLKEILIIAGITTISSSAIVAKVLVDLKRTANRETEMILGIIMFEDIFLAVYISIVSGLVLSGATSLMGVLSSALIALGYMLLLIIVGRKLVPFLNRALNIKSNEVFMITVFAALFLIAGFSETIHVAEAIGALLVGLILAETQHMKRIEHMILPFRDFFGAMFFFSFGLTIDPLSLGGAVWLSIGAVIVTIIGNVAAGMLAGKSAGLNAKASTNIGLTIVSRGEFSIIMANLGKAGALMEILQPFAALYVLILAILGPLLTKESKKIYGLLSKILPVDKAVPAKQTENN